MRPLGLNPDLDMAHNNLGTALSDQGKLDDARSPSSARGAAAPARSRHGPQLPGRLPCSGMASWTRRPAEEPRPPRLRLKPDFAEAHCNLGLVLRRQGRFVEGLAELKRGHELGSKSPNWRYPSAQRVREIERLVELDRKLPGVPGRVSQAFGRSRNARLRPAL